MDKKKLELIIIGVLVVIFALILMSSLKKVKHKSSGPRPRDASMTTVSHPNAVEPLFKGKIEEGKRQEGAPRWGRDPFALEEISLGDDVDTVAGLRLTGIIIDEYKNRKAIINNEVAAVGGRIGKFTVRYISRDSVIVGDDKGRYKVKLR